jgi:hypothetical protein
MNASLGNGISIYIFIDAETQVLHWEGKRQFSMAAFIPSELNDG